MARMVSLDWAIYLGSKKLPLLTAIFSSSSSVLNFLLPSISTLSTPGFSATMIMTVLLPAAKGRAWLSDPDATAWPLTVMAAPAPATPFVMHGARDAFAAGLTHIEEQVRSIEQAVVENPALAFDLALANPPYVPRLDAPHVDRTVSDHEPHLALFGGDDGLDAVRVLLAELPALLLPGTPFLFEIGYGQASEVSGLVEAAPAFALEDVRLDAAGIPRTVVARRR